MKADINFRRLEVLKWAHDHGWILDPFKGMDFHIEDFDKLGFCPCDKTKSRTACPCEESVSDVEKMGKCLCGLFWTEDAVIARVKRYIRSRGKRA